MSNILADFEARAVAFFHTVEGDVQKFAKEFLPVAEHAVEVAFVDLAEIAGRAVMAEAGFVISGQEKFGNAVTHVIQTVETAGKQVGLQTAQAAVQMAYVTAQNIAQGK